MPHPHTVITRPPHCHYPTHFVIPRFIRGIHATPRGLGLGCPAKPGNDSEGVARGNDPPSIVITRFMRVIHATREVPDGGWVARLNRVMTMEGNSAQIRRQTD